METRGQQSRLEAHEEQIQRLQADVAEIKSSLKAIEADRVENAEFRKIMMAWMKQQGKQHISDSSGGKGSGIFFESEEKSGEGVSGGSGGGGRSGGDGGTGEGPDFRHSGAMVVPWAVKKVQLPEFYGFDPQGWIQKAKLFFDINSTPVALRVRLAQLSMVGVAQHWFTIVQQVHDSLTWDQFQLELLQRFSGLEIQNPFEQLASIKQSDSIYDYIDDFEYLLSLVPKLPESQAMGYFVAGLRDEVKRWVRLHRPQSRLDAMYLAKDVEEMLHPSSGNISQSRFRYHQPGGFGNSSKLDRGSLLGPSLIRGTSLVDSGLKGADPPPLPSPRPSVAAPSESSQVLHRDRGVRSLSRAEWEERRKKGLCFRCGQQFGPAHKCPEGKLRVLLLGEDEYETNGDNLYQYEELGSPESPDLTGPGSGAS